MNALTAFVLGICLGAFLVAYAFIQRFRAGFHKALITILNILDKVLSSKKQQESSDGKKDPPKDRQG